MITKINRKNLDIDKYQNCIKNASNYKLYAESWYLDCLTEQQWFCYIWEDYKAVMPVCFNTKIGIKRIMQPTFCQQLGIFYKEPIAKEIFEGLTKKLKQNWIGSYSFNDDNLIQFSIKGKERKNYTLHLNKPYKEIFEGFNKNTKRNIKKSKNLVLKTENINAENSAIYVQQKTINGAHIKEKTIQKLHQLLNHNKFQEYAILVSVYKEDTLLSSVILVMKNNTIYYCNGFNSEKGKKEFASVYLFNELIKKYSDRDMILDFEGSNHAGIAQFFKGFGAINIPYISI